MLRKGQGSGGGVSARGGDTMAAQRTSAARKSGIMPHAASSTSSGGGSAVSGSAVTGGPASGGVSTPSPTFALSIVSALARFFCEPRPRRYGRARRRAQTHAFIEPNAIKLARWATRGQRRRGGDERRDSQRRPHEGKPIPNSKPDGSMPTPTLPLLQPLGLCKRDRASRASPLAA